MLKAVKKERDASWYALYEAYRQAQELVQNLENAQDFGEFIPNWMWAYAGMLERRLDEMQCKADIQIIDFVSTQKRKRKSKK